MKLLQIYNQYRSLFGGEETVVRKIAEMAESNGVETHLLMRSSRGLDSVLSGKARAFSSGIYNPFARREVSRFVAEFRPDVVHVHNLYPLFSPSVLSAIRRQGVPIVMTVHNHFHTCPNSDHLYKGVICTKCAGGREYFCVLQNCRGNLFESWSYAVRSATARKLRLFTGNVTLTIALNEFARQKLMIAGFAPDQIVVLPNSVEIPEKPANARDGEYVIFSGRMVPGKGVTTLVEAARRCSGIPVGFFGGGPSLNEFQTDMPMNTMFHGQVNSDVMSSAYRGARFLVAPSEWFEGCPLVILEAMSFGLPVIASRIGGLHELVEDGVTGMLFEPGNIAELTEKLESLWRSPELCQSMGEAGRRKAMKHFNERDYWPRLNEIYESAIDRAKACR